MFALPFALLATFMAAASGPAPGLPGWKALTLIVVCMVLARTVAMTVNRWVDADYDALNPRTVRRAIPTRRLSPGFVLGTAALCSAAFVIGTGGFWLIDDNAWPVILSPVVLAWLVGYSFTKRFTWLCHLFLGSALAISPLAAAIAIEPVFLRSVEPYLLAVMVMFWVAGFDVIYALQDVKVDRETNLYSMPANLGVEPALWISRGLHLLSVAALGCLAGLSPVLGAAFALGVVVVAALLVVEHSLVWGPKTRHLNALFFTLNGMISLLLGALGVFDVVRHVS